MFVPLVLRACQLLFSVIVLGLTVSLIQGRDQTTNVPSQTAFGAFCGGWGVLIALAGFAAIFVEALQGIIISVLDLTATLISLVGGLVFAVTLTTHNCSSDLSVGDTYFYFNAIISPNDGAAGPEGLLSVYPIDYYSRCHEAKAATAFLWFAFVCFAATCVLGIKGRRYGTGGSIV